MSTNILVIEDDRSLAKLYVSRLSKAGFVTSVAHDGKQGLMKIQAERPDIVLMDLMMPIMDGYAVLTALASTENAVKSIPVIVLSNFGPEGDIERVKSLGAVDCLVKTSVSLTEIVAKVREVLAKKE